MWLCKFHISLSGDIEHNSGPNSNSGKNFSVYQTSFPVLYQLRILITRCKFELKPLLATALGDFNAKNNLWFDQDNTSYEGSILNDLMAQYGLTQIIHDSKVCIRRFVYTSVLY